MTESKRTLAETFRDTGEYAILVIREVGRAARAFLEEMAFEDEQAIAELKELDALDTQG